MEAINKLAQKIQQLGNKEFQKYLTIALVVIMSLILGIVYYIHSSSSELVSYMKKIEKDAAKSRRIVETFEKIKAEEDRILGLLEKNKEFSLNQYFETFYKGQGIKPEDGWSSTVNVLNEQFDEVELPATFKGQTTQKLVTILQEIDKQEVVYVKDLKVRADKNKTIIFDIVIATLRKK